jgi:hypothetical protein
MRKYDNVAGISLNKIGKMRKEEAPSFPHILYEEIREIL